MPIQNRTKRLTVCAMLCALGVVILWMASILSVIDLSMAVLASLLCVVAVIEYGGVWPWMIYAGTSVLSLVLVANKSAAAFYALFFGFYPILKEMLEKHNRVFAWVCKEILFHLALAGCFVVWKIFFPQELMISLPIPLWVVFILMLELVFVLYDVALTRLISFYVYRLRHRFRFF